MLELSTEDEGEPVLIDFHQLRVALQSSVPKEESEIETRAR